MKFLLFAFLLTLSIPANAQWSGNTSPSYPELIAYYQKLDREHPEIELYAMGGSDTDYPIYVCIVNGAQDSLKTFEKARSSTTMLINNAIHAGEPDGVNACLLWLDNWIRNGKQTKGIPVMAIIPAYNVGGMLNRSSFSRANQDGPQEYGFRGNGQNLDLNRDFIKMDSPNALTFAKIWQALDPDVFVDTHVSNGADYQYTLTMIASMKERMTPVLRRITHEKCIPDLTRQLAKDKIDLFTYVELKEDTPDKGIVAFNDLPRYAMGYASLFHSLSFTVETHMLKPFPKRVEATQRFIEELADWTGKNKTAIEMARRESMAWAKAQEYFRFDYTLTEKADSVLFKGFKAVYKASEISGLQRLSYDRSQPYQKYIPQFATHTATDSVKVPKGYIVSVGAADVIERLKANGVVYRTIRSDSAILLTTLRVNGYETAKSPYEGHYLHHSAVIGEESETVTILRGSVWVPVQQDRSIFVLSVLEPAAEDSYFSWNFFDSYLQRKEHYSSYVFEDIAVELLKNDAALAQEFAAKKKADPAFAASAEEQLFFIYKRSPYFEKSTAGRLPVYKVY